MSDFTYPVRRWRISPDWMVDVTVAAVSIFAAVILHTEVVRSRSGLPGATVALGVAVAHGAVVLGRRRRPLAVLAASLITGWLYVALGFPAFMLGPAVLFVIYSVAAGVPRPRSLHALLVAEVNMAALLAVGTGFPGPGSIALYAGIIGSAWLLGDLVSRWRMAAEAHARRASELAETREELARHAVAEERRRIARELHDVVAHSMTVVAMHAGTGRLVGTTDPDAAISSLVTIERVSRDALAEMRRLVWLLRDEGREESQLAPVPGLTDIHRLVAEMAATGLVVDVATEGRLDRVPPGPALAAYRIVQEALTNAARHAGAVGTQLRVAVGEQELVVVVENEPPAGAAAPSSDSGSGMGLVGMRERVQLYDGTMTARARPDGGFRMEARLPFSGERP